MSVEKEEKPKKMFSVTFTIWDDGEIDTEIYHFKKTGTGRGAPAKWRLKPEEFKNVFEDTLGSFSTIVDDMNKGIGVNTIVQQKLSAPKVETVAVEKPKETKKKEKSQEVSESSDDDIDFGDFDKQK